ncbi:hypothetical protein GCM10023088_49630 [Actinomadura verrucosospora]|uniref:hypothetical protein n=1 Tax=Actinomadura verrucosospora TaxID=46165 RepID=UPI0031EFDDB5
MRAWLGRVFWRYAAFSAMTVAGIATFGLAALPVTIITLLGQALVAEEVAHPRTVALQTANEVSRRSVELPWPNSADQDDAVTMIDRLGERFGNLRSVRWLPKLAPETGSRDYEALIGTHEIAPLATL